MLGNSQTFEARLQYLVVMQKVYLEVSSPFNFIQWHFLGVSSIKDMTVNGSRAQLLNFSDRRNQQIINPVDNLMPRGIIARVSHLFVIFNIINNFERNQQ